MSNQIAPTSSKLDQVEEWVRQRAKNNISIERDLDLIDSGIISSLQMMEFILFIEEVYDIELDLENMDPTALRSLSSIEKVIFDMQTFKG